MAQGVASVWVPVKDMDRAVSFYREALGFEVGMQSADWSEIKANGLMIGLNAREGAGDNADGGAVISFQPDGSIEDDKADLEGRGVTFTGEISSHEWGKIVPFKDSEGNDLQLYSPPAQ